MENNELKPITGEMRAKLNAPFASEAMAKHPTKKFLTTIKAIYITERLNDVFGVGRWNIVTTIVKETGGYVLMSGELKVLDYDVVVPVQYGGHKTTGTNTEFADGYKSAVTDCLSKCASYLEVGLEVFKGQVSPPTDNTANDSQPKKQYADDSRPWLKEEELKEMLRWIKEGQGEIVRNKMNDYRMKKIYKQELNIKLDTNSKPEYVEPEF